MLRIAATGISAESVGVVGQRVHGALVEFCDCPAPKDPVWQSADALAVLNATDAQADEVETALRAGKHVVVVSRAGLPVELLDRLEAIAREQGVLLAVENPDHALPSRRLIRQQLDNEKLGEVGLVRVQRCEPTFSTDVRSVTEVPASLIGDLETVVWLVGRPPDRVYAIRRRIAPLSAPLGDCVQIHLGFPFGGMALVTLTTAWPSAESHQSLSVIAATGAAYADGHQNRQLLFSEGRVTAPLADEGDATAVLLQEFVANAQNAVQVSGRLNSWRRLAKLVGGVAESLATHLAVKLEFD